MASIVPIDKNISQEPNKLVIIGNGFDLAHGLKTSYKNFLDWYICKSFDEFYNKKTYSDSLIEITNKYSGQTSFFEEQPKTFEKALELINLNENQSINYISDFLKRLIDSYQEKKWVDIEHYYFRLLKSKFSNKNIGDNKDEVFNLNKDFDVIIKLLANYIETINKDLSNNSKLKINNYQSNLRNIFNDYNRGSRIKFINFNYTDTLQTKFNVLEDDVIYIHGRVSDINNNPIIFGYGDESDPAFQNIEDSAENIYLEHIKSFGYFKTNNYKKLLSFIDSGPYITYIIGHSCGLSDRILLNEIFEHHNCEMIDIFYHKRHDGSDNFKEITQEISRHFKPHNKNLMRRRISNKDPKNIIPLN